MSKFLVVFLTLSAVPLGLACDRKDPDSQGAAQTSAAQSDLQKVRDDYLRQKRTDLDLIDKGVAALEAKEKAVSVRSKEDLHGAIVLLKSARETYAKDLHEAEATPATAWVDAKVRLEKEWTELKTAADKATSLGASAFATRKPATMTCEEFLALTDVEKPKIVYWAAGYSKSGKPTDSVVDVAETDRLVPVLVTECTKDPKASMSKAVQQHAATSPKPAVSAPAPGKMTCEQFVAMEDVVRPKLVYWAQGFGVGGDGGVTETVVDVDETDRLVPVLVTECKESPKLTLWQKLKKYL